MKKYLLIFFLLLYVQNSVAQVNLVSNPSFEDYDTCPDFFSQLSRSNGWWSAKPTADYFNVCSPYFTPPISCVNVPYNSFGYRTPASGNAYAGIISKQSVNEHRENIGRQLDSPLIVGNKYYVSFKVSSGARLNINQWCGINKLGALFSTIRYDTLNPAPICDSCAQIISDSIITDSLNWIMIKGEFIADSGYLYINIGRFSTNATTDSIQITGTNCYAYYFIDDVCVSDDSTYAFNYSYTEINNEIREKELIYYPNPTNDVITLAGFGEGIKKLTLYNSEGRLLNELNYPTTNIIQIDLSFYPSGFYYIEISSKVNSFIKLIKL